MCNSYKLPVTHGSCMNHTGRAAIQHHEEYCCFKRRDTLDALGGHYVLNSGTFLGPSKLLLTYVDAMLEELQQRWHCRRLHGSDQAIHNFLVYTGKFIGTGMLT